MLFTRPQVGSYEPRKSLIVPFWYCSSPRVRIRSNCPPTSRSDVAFCWHVVAVTGAPGMQAMSPAAAMRTEPTVAGGVVAVAELLDGPTLPAASRARTVYV